MIKLCNGIYADSHRSVNVPIKIDTCAHPDKTFVKITDETRDVSLIVELKDILEACENEQPIKP